MALRAQTSIEFLLILSAVVLVVLAGVMSLSEIMKMQQSAYSAVQGGVENASAGLLTYLSNETFGTGFYPISGGFGEYTNASLVALEVTKNEPYFINQPSIIKLTAWNNYPAPMKVPKLALLVLDPSGNETALSPSEEENVTIILSHTLTATFIPSGAGVYNLTAVAQDENGSVLINPVSNDSVVIRTNFTVLDSRPPSSGVIKTFNIEDEVAVERNTAYVQMFLLPQDAVIYSAVLEITEPHLYEDSTSGAQASYHYSQISECYCPQGTACSIMGVVSSEFFSRDGVFEIPQHSFIESASYSTNKIAGDAASVFINGELNPPASSVVRPGTNTISLSIEPEYNRCPPSPPTSSHESRLATGDATISVIYYYPSTRTAMPSDLMSIEVNDGPLHSPYSVEDISSYVRAGGNTVQFFNLQGSFKYKLVVTYA
ncbi:MAG: hypothetical protein Sv326_0783 [Candidatus Fermentimicrarchaeum limneticum]|uniref:Uncharacterized protein n=1 Tax=Fermentimicrarchaeum limneticum TaxID=2795018 RepID=A0A7D6BM18_FERL1|nr:MAG: hypothetical protein Sv326_0783 [Candidatus Fermentimicrarchaeum limneticum]